MALEKAWKTRGIFFSYFAVTLRDTAEDKDN